MRKATIQNGRIHNILGFTYQFLPQNISIIRQILRHVYVPYFERV